MSRCPICKKEFDRPAAVAFPFCSPRCRLIDLGKWFGEEYRIPGRPEENEDEAPTPTPAPADEDAKE